MRNLRFKLLMNIIFAALIPFGGVAEAQSIDRAETEALEYKIRPGKQRVSMYVNTTKIITLEGK